MFRSIFVKPRLDFDAYQSRLEADLTSVVHTIGGLEDIFALDENDDEEYASELFEDLWVTHNTLHENIERLEKVKPEDKDLKAMHTEAVWVAKG